MLILLKYLNSTQETAVMTMKGLNELRSTLYRSRHFASKQAVSSVQQYGHLLGNAIYEY